LSLFIGDPGLTQAFGLKEHSLYAGLFFFGMLYSPLSFAIGIFLQMFSRHNEFEADRYSVETTPDREQLVNALKKVSVSNLANLTPHPFYVFLHYSHPPMLERIKAIRSAPSAAR
jgi:STE24 endopeptidase